MKNNDFALEFAQMAGEMAESVSFNRSLGQIYGYLYLSDKPLSLDDIAKSLSMSKSNASMNLRTLDAWGAVREVWVEGSRRDYYEANTNIKQVVLRRLEEGISRRLDRADDYLKRLGGGGKNGLDPAARKRLEQIKGMLSRGRKAVSLLPKVLKFLS